MKISILVPFHNEEAFIAEAVESLKKQTYESFQAILVDNASTDNSKAAAMRAVGTDNRFIFETEQEPGIAHALNKGLARATGEWVTFLDADDYFLPERLEKAMKTAETSEADLVICRGYKVSRYGETFGESERLVFDEATFPLIMAQRNICWSMSFLTLRRDKLNTLVPFPLEYSAILDYYLILGAIAGGWRITFIDEPLVGKRHHGDNYSADEFRLMGQEIPLTVDFLERYASVGRVYSRAALRRIATRKYLRGVQYARRHGRIGDVPGFAKAFVDAGWIEPAFYVYYNAMAVLQTGGVDKFREFLERNRLAHPLYYYLEGIDCFQGGCYVEAGEVFRRAGRPFRGRFVEAGLGSSLAEAMMDRPRGMRMLKRVLNGEPGYIDALVAWQRLIGGNGVVSPTLFLREATLSELLEWVKSYLPDAKRFTYEQK
ncbi:MAG: glycosyltransferase family 2 protein [Candidatus Aminicenantes bacterium]|nr:glycosyltransferase family 2 protein [Candidatus Aminicenantes bacterium]